MRKSIEDMYFMVKDVEYTGLLPDTLQKYHVCLIDSGHCILCVLETHLEQALKMSMDKYEVPVPVKYVIEKGYRVIGDYIIVNATYDDFLGLVVDDKYREY